MIKKYFGWAIGIALVVYTAMFIDVFLTVGLAAAFTVLYQALSLSAVEVAVSFDNAAVNATHLPKMNPFWQKMFLTVGILIAVVGMRFYLPLQIVSWIGDLSIIDSYHLAVDDGAAFGKILADASATIAGFGGAFLLMTGLAFFVSADKEANWISWFEVPLQKLGELTECLQIKGFMLRPVEAAVTLGLGYMISAGHGNMEFFHAAIGGLLVFYAVDLLKLCFEALDEKLSTSKAKWIAGGLGTFIYLEVLDASFSFDGVVAAFALSDNLWVIAGALGVGAAFVRCMTVMLHKTGAMKTYEFLENGAFVAILFLAASMYIGEVLHLPHWIVAVTSILSIAAAVYSSVKNETPAEAAEKTTV